MELMRTTMFLILLLLALTLFIPFARSALELFVIQIDRGVPLVRRRPFSLHPELYDDPDGRSKDTLRSDPAFRRASRRMYIFGALFAGTLLIAAMFFTLTAPN